MNWKYIILIVFILLCITKVEAQRWKKYRYEFSYGIGSTNFMGDVGAPESKGLANFFWINPHSFRPVANIGLGYSLSERVQEKANLHMGWLSASDEHGAWDTRNLKFNSIILELSLETHIYLVKEKRKINIYRRNQRFKRKLQNINVPTYLFFGLGGAFTTTNLELTEENNIIFGSGTIFGKNNTFTLTTPIGIGFRYKMTNRIYLGLEASLRYTLSDKIDNHMPPTGEWIDAYQFLIFNVNYKLQRSRSGLPRFKMSY